MANDADTTPAPSGKARTLTARWLTRRNIILGISALAIAGLLVAGGAAAGVLAQRAGLPGKAADKVQASMAGFSSSMGWTKPSDVRPVGYREFSTHLVDINEYTISVGPFDGGSGGAIEEYGDGVLFVEPKGPIGYAGYNGVVTYLDERPPMNLAEMIAWIDASPVGIYLEHYRMMDALVVKEPTGQDFLYVSHHKFNSDCILFAISRIGVSLENGLPVFSDAGWEEVFTARPCVPIPPNAKGFAGLEGGGKMVEGSPGKLIVTVGDFEINGMHGIPAVEQDPNFDLGKTIELDTATGESRIISMGHRNQQGLVIDSQGRIWTTEHGPRGGDELNLIIDGKDYGHPVTTFGTDYGNPREDWPTNKVQGWHDRAFEWPVYFYSPSIGLSAIVEGRGPQFDLWSTDLLITTLVGQKFLRMRLDGNSVISVETLDIGERLRDMIWLKDGSLAILTDGGNIRIWRNRKMIEDAQTVKLPAETSGYIALAAARAADPTMGKQMTRYQVGERRFRQHCSSCHSLDGTPGPGPSLRGILNRNIASQNGYGYSQPLKEMDGKWTEGRLKDFIYNPQAVAPGSTMGQTAIYSSDIGNLMEYLREQ
jgi:cytochrome c2